MRRLPTAPGERISGCDCCPNTVNPCGDGVIDVMKAAAWGDCGGASNDMLPPGGASVTRDNGEKRMKSYRLASQSGSSVVFIYSAYASSYLLLVDQKAAARVKLASNVDLKASSPHKHPPQAAQSHKRHC